MCGVCGDWRRVGPRSPEPGASPAPGAAWAAGRADAVPPGDEVDPRDAAGDVPDCACGADAHRRLSSQPTRPPLALLAGRVRSAPCAGRGPGSRRAEPHQRRSPLRPRPQSPRPQSPRPQEPSRPELSDSMLSASASRACSASTPVPPAASRPASAVSPVVQPPPASESPPDAPVAVDSLPWVAVPLGVSVGGG